MVVFSTLRQKCRILTVNFLKPNSNLVHVAKRYDSHGHRTFQIEGSEWNWKKSKDLFHFYTCVAAIIYGSMILYANFIVGSPILAEIPEGYRPKHWEYYRHPISRFIQRYGFMDEQKAHELMLFELYCEDELIKMRELDQKVRNVMKQKRDYQAYYYRPLTVAANTTRLDKEETDQLIFKETDDLMEGFNPNFEDKDGAYTDEFPVEMGTPQG